ncbi:DUF4188 domain-containing protein [Streptomyces sp. P38-E01]|uniref:DUF4188 domain-containing protein n=1 Tax=Streptomyces tardus TaxID=2780544 RepID=A0A949N028_9ACTN|nr:DUF4188 domain-containing protein [Streptomyces tardus]
MIVARGTPLRSLNSASRTADPFDSRGRAPRSHGPCAVRRSPRDRSPSRSRDFSDALLRFALVSASIQSWIAPLSNGCRCSEFGEGLGPGGEIAVSVAIEEGRVGFWYETYVVPAGAHEAVYLNMPRSGLGGALGVIPVGRRGETAAGRMRAARMRVAG